MAGGRVWALALLPLLLSQWSVARPTEGSASDLKLPGGFRGQALGLPFVYLATIEAVFGGVAPLAGAVAARLASTTAVVDRFLLLAVTARRP
jgi:hypothetical protein